MHKPGPASRHLRSPGVILGTAGCLGWLEFALSQAAQRWQLLPWIGWRLSNDLDAFCALGGTGLLLAALVVAKHAEYIVVIMLYGAALVPARFAGLW